MTARLYTTAIGALIVATLSAQAPPPAAIDRVTEAEARAILKANMDSLNDPQYTEAVKDLQRSYFKVIFAQSAGEHVAVFTGDPVPLVSEDGLEVTAIGPALSFSMRAAERLRLLDPKPQVAWRNVVEIHINPTSLSSPDIIKAVLRSGTATVAPVASTLAPKSMTTAMGVKRTVNSGVLTFPISAFSGAEKIIQLLLIPREGQNITRLFKAEDLQRIQ